MAACWGMAPPLPRRAALVLAGWPLVAGALDLKPLLGAGSGRIVHRERDLPPFTGLRVGGALPVELAQVQAPRLLIDADDDVVDGVEAVVDGGVLALRYAGRRSPTRLRIVVQVWVLDRLDLSGNASVSGTGLVAKRLQVQASGSSQLRLEDFTAEALALQGAGSAVARVDGRANELDVSLSGSAQLQAAGFQVRRAGVKLGGAAGARLWATDTLDGAIGGASQLRYRGEPALQVARGGAAKVSRAP